MFQAGQLFLVQPHLAGQRVRGSPVRMSWGEGGSGCLAERLSGPLVSLALASQEKWVSPAKTVQIHGGKVFHGTCGTLRLTNMEVDGMARWMTIFFYQQVVVHFHVMCS